MKWRKILIWILALILIAFAGVAHFRYWYGARARLAELDPTTLPAQLLASDELPFAVWLPYPHQNLAQLGQATNEDGSYLDAFARLAGLPPPRLPAFGPFAVPPASEITLAADEKGERFAVYARVYPTMAIFARLAGALAKNPWLRGGQVFFEGEPVQVSWHGNVWTVTSGVVPKPKLKPGTVPEGPVLAWLRLGQQAGPAVAGRYRLALQAGVLELSSERASDRLHGLEDASLDSSALFLLLLSGRSPEQEAGARALAFFAAESGGSTDLPRAASLSTPGIRPFRLPGQQLLKLGGLSPRRGEREGWRIEAIDRTCLQGARDLAPHMSSLLGDTHDEALAWGLWLDLAGGAEEVARIARVLEQVPSALIPDAEIRRWKDAGRVLAPLNRRYSKVTVTVRAESQALRLRLVPRKDIGESAQRVEVATESDSR
jgi:hypothetical protein